MTQQSELTREPTKEELFAEVERLRATEAALKERLRIEALTAEISARFINLPIEQIEDGIRESLRALALATGVERAYVFLLTDDGRALGGAYEWCKEGVKPHPLDEFAGVSVDAFPWSMRQWLRGETIYVASPAALPPEAAPEKGACDMLDIVSYVNVPIFQGGAMAGWMGFDSVDAPKTWAPEDVVLLKVAGEAIVGALGRKRRAEELAVINAELKKTNQELTEALRAVEERDRRLDDDLRQASSFQQVLLPPEPQTEHLRSVALFRPLARVGGDIYDIVELSPGRFRFFLADAPGHGVQAALRTMVIKTEYDRIKTSAEDPAAALGALNLAILRAYRNIELPFTACCFDLAPLEEGRGALLRCASAGHPSLLLLPRRSPDAFEEIGCRGAYLGIAPSIELELRELRVDAGARLAAFSDGLTEQPGDGGELFGVSRIAAALSREGRTLAEAVADVQASLDSFRAGREIADDTTVLVVEIS